MCVPACADKECDDDGCGGSCGTCAADEACDDGLCEAVCIPNCADKDCGPDGCGGSCGTCADGEVCLEADLFAICAEPLCDPACGANEECVDGACQPICTPNCADLECGPDGCGGTCGTCEGGEVCADGLCVPPPDNPLFTACMADGGKTMFTSGGQVTGNPEKAASCCHTNVIQCPPPQTTFCVGHNDTGQNCAP